MMQHGLPEGGRAARLTLALILVGRLLLGFAYSALNPLGEAPDEADHYAYAAYIEKEHRLPEGPTMTQAKHPPLYHLLAAGLAAAAGADMDFGFLRSNPDGGVRPDAAAPNLFIHTQLEAWPWSSGALAMHLGRLVSVIAGVVLTAAAYALGRAIWPRWYGGPLAAAAFVAFLPESLFIGGAMNNDILAAMWCTLALWLGLRATHLSHAILAGMAMGLAFLTKVSTVGLWPVVCVAILINRRSAINHEQPIADGVEQHSRRGAAGRAVLAGIVASLIAIPWLWRNWRLYGDLLGWPLVLATIDQRQGPLTFADLLALGRGWFVSFWGKTGAAGHLSLPLPFYVLWVLLVLLALLGWLLVWRRKGSPAGQHSDSGAASAGRPPEAPFVAAGGVGGSPAGQRSDSGVASAGRPPEAPFVAAGGVGGSDPIGRVTPAGWVVLLGAPVMTVLSILSYSRVALGTDQGRLLFPAIAPIALLLVRGIAGWLPPKGYGWLPVGVASGMALVAGLALVAGIIQPFAPPLPPPATDVASATQAGETFGDQLELVGFRWAEASEIPRLLGQTSNAGGKAMSSADAESRVVSEVVPLTLYWRAPRRLADDLRTALRLTDDAGNLVWEWKRSPGAGRFSTDRWPAQRVVRDVYLIPSEALARTARVELGVRPFSEGDWLPPASHPTDSFVLVAKPVP